jgi:hypothetical protein
MALLGLLGLVMASQARDDVIYGTGLGVFLFGVLFVFALIGRTGGADKTPRIAEMAAEAAAPRPGGAATATRPAAAAASAQA